MLDIIVPVRNTPALFNSWHNYISRNTTVPYEIYVGDNSTDDRVKKEMEGKDKIHYSHHVFNGLSKIFNDVIKQGTNPYVAIINSDCYVTKGWDRIINYIGLKDLGVITTTDSRNLNNNVHKYLDHLNIKGTTEANFESHAEILVNDYVNKEKVYAYEVNDYIKTNIKSERQESSPATGNACFIVKRSVFEDVGGFDENFGLYHEDIDFLGRINLKYKVGLALDTLSYHIGSVTVREIGMDDHMRYLSALAFGKRWG